MKRIYLETYGCQMNVADSELMLGVMGRAGYQRTEDPAEADVMLLNTCAVRDNAEQRVIGRMGELQRFKRPGGVRTFPLLSLSGAGLFLAEPTHALLDADRVADRGRGVTRAHDVVGRLLAGAERREPAVLTDRGLEAARVEGAADSRCSG